MEKLQSAFEPYRHLDPEGWVSVYRLLPVWGGLLAIVIGTVLMLFGGRALFRVVAGPLGALLATVGAVPLATRFGWSGSTEQLSAVAMFTLFVVGIFWPPVVVFFVFGVPAGLLGGHLVGPSDWLLGFGPGFFFGGAVGIVLHRQVGALLSAMVGAWALVLGVMAALNPYLSAVEWLARTPIAVLTVAGCFALSGASFQLVVRPAAQKAKGRKLQMNIGGKRPKAPKVLEAR